MPIAPSLTVRPRLRPSAPLRRSGLLGLGAVLMLAGCASTQVGSQWSDPQFAGNSLRGAKVLVVCVAPELPLRQICQDRMAAEVTALGASPVIAAEDPTAAQRPMAEAHLGAARRAGARAIFGTAVSPDAKVARSGPSIGIGVGGFGSRIGGGLGVSLPIGGGGVATALGATGTLTDVASGRTMWTATASAPSSETPAEQVGSLGRVLANAAQKAGFF